MEERSLAETLSESPQLSILTRAIQETDLLQTLEKEGPFTLFAPSDAAFAKLPDGALEELLQEGNEDVLASILKYHIISGKVASSELTDGQVAATLQGENFVISTSDGVKVNGALVATPDIAAGNGMIHIIDEVLLPLSMQPKNIAQLVLANENLSYLASALQSADLIGTLSQDGTFTMFAPTDDAFEALPEGMLIDLLKPENKETLGSLLGYHVIGSKLMAEDLQNDQSIITVQGESMTVNLKEGVKVNDAVITGSNIEASNGVMHLVNQVILPPSMVK
jgi:transforming growth factor-beta-induced protein